MFDKKKFANILQQIIEYYGGQRKLTEKSCLSRTMISYYLNEKKDKPPKPMTLKKIADASSGITNYKELMIICGYVSQPMTDFTLNMYKEINNMKLNSFIDLTDFNEDEKEEINAYIELKRSLKKNKEKNK